ncbi:hypothetical protein LCGC14_1588800 [marine sediment metagenome]|uniref:Uncharacterized protein n=1 Tax=marine sediment metagenome TaxID=412755 RepID=A0A0F9J0W9_9ZZZZ
MKVYKSETNEYGWYWVIHKNNGGNLRFFHKNIRKDRKDYEGYFAIHGEGLKLLKEVFRKTKQRGNQ